MNRSLRDQLRAIACACSDPQTTDALDRVLAMPDKPGKWVSGPPPKRGPWKVRCDGPSPNAGYRYWDGERWGVLCRSRGYCQQIKGTGRVRPLDRPVLWWSPTK